eukprot:TRINITY_DN5072_c0_g1_i2.p2 TRINITY_DN5072_c0_g1~~TRINITY_DN5072_c0_g1_i2.p2  ORF type:complete len:331 (+),score=75.68 TRINITY_DN5072_c0_g1_i2:139-993(+)
MVPGFWAIVAVLLKIASAERHALNEASLLSSSLQELAVLRNRNQELQRQNAWLRQSAGERARRQAKASALQKKVTSVAARLEAKDWARNLVALFNSIKKDDKYVGALQVADGDLSNQSSKGTDEGSYVGDPQDLKKYLSALQVLGDQLVNKSVKTSDYGIFVGEEDQNMEDREEKTVNEGKQPGGKAPSMLAKPTLPVGPGCEDSDDQEIGATPGSASAQAGQIPGPNRKSRAASKLKDVQQSGVIAVTTTADMNVPATRTSSSTRSRGRSGTKDGKKKAPFRA